MIEETPIDEAALLAFIGKHEKEVKRFYSGDPVQRAQEIVEHYHRIATQSLYHTEQFKTELLVLLRAMSLVADSVGEAATHSEKNARLRGLTAILESGYTRISKYELDISRYSWAWEDVFRSDYPVRNYLEQIEELKAENERLKNERARREGKQGASDEPDL